MDETAARTFESFGYEWNRFDSINAEDEEFWRRYVADVDLERLAGLRALDAGCGKGRYTRFTARHVGSLVALDWSAAVQAAARNLAEVPNAVVVRADLQRAPFPDRSFGFVSCLGVLHHLGDPAAGFRALTRLLAPGGTLLVYLYSRPESAGVRATGLHAATALRRVSVRIPHPLLRLLAAPLAAALYLSVVVPGRIGDTTGIAPLSRLPLSIYRGQPVRSLWLDTFDRLSAPLERRYTWSELEPWYAEAGLTVRAVREDAGLYIVAERPSR